MNVPSIHSFHSSRAKDMQAAQIFVTSPRWLSNGIAPIAFAESQFSSFSNQNSSSSNHRSGGFCTARPPSRPKVKGDWKLEDRIFIPPPPWDGHEERCQRAKARSSPNGTGGGLEAPRAGGEASRVGIAQVKGPVLERVLGQSKCILHISN